MTPFGMAMRTLRQRKGVTQRALAQAIGVTPAYLSALEHGRRGRPTFELLQRIAGYFNIIWDEAEELFRLANVSDPRVVVDTAGLPAEYTMLANELAKRISTLPPDVVEEMTKLLKRNP
ncbi:Transcriptional regulator, contains XRE-family HTH domain [Rhizobium sp. NFR07]|jgi:transcriptional regulator with XRE-family HTH domain|uniref:helix-turn-helix domain-containing protein n=1 Tax=Rhizobium sp. NFR07 TaxID=1566262 RepID=UPI0008E99FCD|nr:helix-turn-helix domain-containing protein [Rhizobium sp. NFR07]SFB54510.1 Transcriptional regulator, contains XRE-family HTH domain [Rhizobium sp. NFR07]